MASFRVLPLSEVRGRVLIDLAQERRRRAVLSFDRLAGEPTADLAAEVRRRGLLVLDPVEERVLPGLTLCAGGRWARWRGGFVPLSRRESDVLCVLARLWPHTVTSQRLQAAVWGAGEPLDARCYVAYLRKRLPGLIETVGWAGYRLALEPSGGAP